MRAVVGIAAAVVLSALLWLQASHALSARASIATYSRLGLVLVPLTITAALASLLAERI